MMNEKPEESFPGLNWSDKGLSETNYAVPYTKEISDNFLIFGIGKIFNSIGFTELFYSIVWWYIHVYIFTLYL